jgi:hypothetical protein
VRSHLRPCKLLRRKADNLVRHRLSAAEDISRHGCRSDALVGIVNIVDIPGIDDVFYVRDISDVRNVHRAQIVRSIVIPREEWIARS